MLCKCGCGEVTPIATRTRGSVKKGEHMPYALYHSMKGARADFEPPNASGLCQCGCGQPAPIARQTDRRLGYVGGQPVRFIRGHVVYTKQRDSITTDLWHEEDRGYETPCWIWNGAPQSKAGYCRVHLRSGTRLAHRASYEQFVGPIPEGLQLDHLCRVPSCVNPEHLEPVTHAENGRRGRATKLTRADADLIRCSTLSASRLARVLGVDRQTIYDIRAGRSWK